MKKKILESDIQKAIIDFLRYKGHFVWKNLSVGIKKANGSYIPVGMRGLPDIMAIKNGRLFALEVKSGRNTASDDQKRVLEELEAKGAIVGVVYSIDDVEILLNNVPRGTI